MITRSLCRLHGGERRGPVAGPTHKGVLPRPSTGLGIGAGRPGPPPDGLACERLGRWEQAQGATVANNYWSSTTYSSNPSNAWNVNFNDGNVNANNKTNNNYVRAVRGGS